MNQPPNDPFYNAPTQGAGFPQQGSAPNYPPPSGYPPSQGPMSQPGFPPAGNYYPQQGSAPNYSPPSGYPPSQGPMSQPGFPPAGNYYPQQGPTPTYPPQQPQQPSWPGIYPQPQGPVSYPGQPAQGFAPPGGYPQGPQSQDQFGAPPAWPNLTQPPEGPKKSNKGMIAAISIVVVLVLILGGIGAAFALRSRGPAVNALTPVAQNTPTTNGPTPAATQPSGSTPSSGTSGNLNQPVQAGNWVVIITHVTATTASALPPKAGSTYLEITLTLKNTSATTQLVSSLLQFSLVDASGGKYDEALTDTNVHQPPDGNVNAGQTLNAQLAYEVPLTQHNFVLSFNYGLIEGNNATATWQLAA